MSNRERVLVIDEISDTAEVLQAVLEPRGLAVNRVRRFDPSRYATIDSRPTIVVFDAESSGTESLATANATTWGGWTNIPQVIIGTVKGSDSDTGKPTAGTARRHYLQKPFQYSELIQAIELLIASQPPQVK